MKTFLLKLIAYVILYVTVFIFNFIIVPDEVSSIDGIPVKIWWGWKAKLRKKVFRANYLTVLIFGKRVIYAHIKTTKGFTLIANNSDFEKALTNFTIRYPNFEINRDMIIEFRGKTYTIQYLNNVDEANTELEIQAKLVEK